MEVNLATSEHLAGILPDDLPRISESGIKTPEDVVRLKECGFDGFLIGELFMKNSRPERACMKFIDQLKVLKDSRKVYEAG
jgi:indole-3-glycerol phosphate synthase